MLINNLSLVFIKSSLTNHAVVVECNDGTEVVVHLLDPCIYLIELVKESLGRMEAYVEGSTDIYRYLFLCSDSGRYALMYSDSPIVRWELLRNNE
jgi:hypothetical protein